MAEIDRLAREHTEIAASELESLRRLVAQWDLIADLGFADLVLWLPTWNGAGYVAAAQRRPDTGRTSLSDDVVGRFVAKGRRPGLDRALAAATAQSDPISAAGIEVDYYPIGDHGAVQAVLARYTSADSVEGHGRMAQVYRDAANELCQMVVSGDFPVRSVDGAVRMRVGGGLIRLQPNGVVGFASPNATSAFRRLGAAVDLEGAALAPLCLRIDDRPDGSDPQLARVARGSVAGRAEMEHGDTTVVLEAIPMRRAGIDRGSLVLVRDISELRSRDRALVSTEAALREVHHRIKNNLQMVAALLRLQSRRVGTEESRTALLEAGHRIGAIAVVHEVLAASPDAAVDLDLVADRIVALSSELAPGASIRREGRLGSLRAPLATSVAMCLAELVANAVEHGGPGVHVTVIARRDSRLQISVEDDGPGLPEDFNPQLATSLGMQIVRTLAEENGGTVQWRNRAKGSVAQLSLPLTSADETAV